MITPKAFLGVSHSALNNRWVAREHDLRAAQRMSQEFGYPAALAQAIASRGVGPDAVQSFLQPRLKTAMPDPSHLIDLDKAVERVITAMRDNERIGVFGDFDVDGATSSAIVRRYLRWLGVDSELYIPDRYKEGYGPNVGAMETLAERGVQCLLTLDCGVASHEPLARAAELGMDVVVLDHHLAPAELPVAHAVVNPNRVDETSEIGHIAACGLSFLFVVALNRRLRQENWFADHEEPDLLKLLDMVALGTVADVVPLKGINRAFVAQGLIKMAEWHNPGLAALKSLCRVEGQPVAENMGFDFGPRLNAGSRMGHSDLAARLLCTDDPQEAADIAARLDELNKERRSVEGKVQRAAERQALADGFTDPLVAAAGDGWHQGVLGIVAGRLKGKYKRAAICVGFDETGVGKGSGRSIPGFNLGEAVVAAKSEGLLVEGGGHAMAAGVTVLKDRFPAFRDFMAERAAEALATSPDPDVMAFDGAVSAGAVNATLIGGLEALEPFGQGNPQPRFAVTRVRATYANVVGKDHVAAQLEGSDGSRLRAIAFKSLETPLGQMLMNAKDRPIHVGGVPIRDTYRGGDHVQLRVEDAAYAEE